ncbi:MAG: helix-turn-helix domain-containing protein [Opitutaceae bacterium]
MNPGGLNLSDSIRLERIGEILYDAILASGLLEETGEDEASLPESTRGQQQILSGAPQDQSEARVITYLGRVGEASPSALRTVLGMPRTSAYRVMNRLVESGRILSEGQTRTLVYRLADLSHQQNVEAN